MTTTNSSSTVSVSSPSPGPTPAPAPISAHRAAILRINKLGPYTSTSSSAPVSAYKRFYTVHNNEIQIQESDGNVTQVPEDKPLERTCIMWRRKIGFYIAKVVFKKGQRFDERIWTLWKWPPGYTLWVKKKGKVEDERNVRKDYYLYDNRLLSNIAAGVEHQLVHAALIARASQAQYSDARMCSSLLLHLRKHADQCSLIFAEHMPSKFEHYNISFPRHAPPPPLPSSSIASGMLSFLPLLALATSVVAILPDGRLHANTPPLPLPPIIDLLPNARAVEYKSTDSAASVPPYNTTYYFDQLIDHTNPSLGTFKQRYWHTWEFYEPGGPIILMTPGEANAAPYYGYLTNRTINGLIAQQEKGATIVLEHRFFGLSNPYPDLSVASLKYLTIQQAIDDLEYFAKNVKLPMPGGDSVAPGQAPWVLVGGSYAGIDVEFVVCLARLGALTGFTMVNKTDLFQAGYASSAVVQSISDYWGYFEPIRQYMPKNCSADVQAVIAHFDAVFTWGSDSEIAALKAEYGMADVTHADDVTGALRNNLWDWQSLSPTSGPNAPFFQFCDALEVKDGVSAPASGWGVDHAVSAWGTYFKNEYLSNLCGNATAEECLGTYNASQSTWTDESIDNAGRSWNWIVCNEVGFFQDAAPKGHPTIVSRLVQPAGDEARSCSPLFFFRRQCELMFPAAFSKPPVPDVQKTNEAYDGWNLRVDHLFFANGQRDPWREATVSADGLYVPSTASQPIAVGDGYHCSDLKSAAGEVDATVKKVQDEALQSIHAWLADWSPSI
ncbi:hypothetical protein EW146_g3119 [Bondarzewia mesenterica]|uniref:Uncharacterized protein n=1 Tax=Bondarzewia mesenterica TaxID=1095465 RepID=A0A4S4M4G6_9AGAM|nr:hypothetical protein EW146_g3119 [Bondarzewia mesenterica]